MNGRPVWVIQCQEDEDELRTERAAKEKVAERLARERMLEAARQIEWMNACGRGVAMLIGD